MFFSVSIDKCNMQESEQIEKVFNNIDTTSKEKKTDKDVLKDSHNIGTTIIICIYYYTTIIQLNYASIICFY